MNWIYSIRAQVQLELQKQKLESDTCIGDGNSYSTVTPPPLPKEQKYIRVRAAHNIKQLYKQKSANKQYNSNQATKEYRTLNQIKEKLRSNKAIISKADKGNSTVILYTEDYHNKVWSFIDNNNFTVLNKDPTITFQNQVKATIKNLPTNHTQG
jgi:hypothetical protein